MSTQTLRIIVITAVISLCVLPLVFMAVEGDWGELIVSILGVAGFILTYEVTKPENDEEQMGS